MAILTRLILIVCQKSQRGNRLVYICIYVCTYVRMYVYKYVCIYVLCMYYECTYVCIDVRMYIQGVTGGTDQTSGECSLGHTIPI